jgi:uncharacterized protein YjiK
MVSVILSDVVLEPGYGGRMRLTLLLILCIISSQAYANSLRLTRYDKVHKTIALPEVGYNLSGITYNYDSDTYFVIQNNTGKVFEYDHSFSKPLRVITLLNLVDDDTEDLVYLGESEFAISAENNLVTRFKIGPTETVIDLGPLNQEVSTFQLPRPGKKNAGAEGLCFTRSMGNPGVFFAAQEMSPRAVYQWTLGSKTVIEPFNAQRKYLFRMSDLSACTFDDESRHLLLLSHESSRLIEVDSKGEILAKLNIPKVAKQYEGVTIGAEDELILVSEPATVVILKAKQK